jgi:hypothetical protein
VNIREISIYLSFTSNDQAYAETECSQNYLWVIETPSYKTFLVFDMSLLVMCFILILPVHLVENIFNFDKIWLAVTVLLGVHPFLLDCFIGLDDFLVVLLKKRIIGIAVGMVLQ